MTEDPITTTSNQANNENAEHLAMLKVDIGAYSIKGIKPQNEDFVGSLVPSNNYQLENKGIIAALADGVSSAEAGKEASETAVTNFIEDYFQTPDTWSVSHAGQKILTSVNLKLFKKSHEFTNEEKGYLCTFSGLVIKSQVAHIFHAGDSRIYHLREQELKQVTRDHIAVIGQGRSILARAVGMDTNLQIDYTKVHLNEGDIFLLTSDGVHDFLSSEKIQSILRMDLSPQQIAEKLVNESVEAKSDDNISCVIVKINQLPNESLND